MYGRVQSSFSPLMRERESVCVREREGGHSVCVREGECVCVCVGGGKGGAQSVCVFQRDTERVCV